MENVRRPDRRKAQEMPGGKGPRGDRRPAPDLWGNRYCGYSNNKATILGWLTPAIYGGFCLLPSATGDRIASELVVFGGGLLLL